MWQALVTGISLGLFAAVQPGVFQAFLLGETMRRGLLVTLPLVVAPLVSDVPVAALTLLVLAQTPAWLIASIEVLGGAFVIWLAFDAARPLLSARVDTATTELPAAADHAAQSGAAQSFARRFLRAVAVNGLNPGPWLFWGIVLGPIVVQAWRQGPAVAVVAVGSFYVTLIGAFAGLVALFGLASRRGARVRQAFQAVSVVALAVLGALLVWHGASGILRPA